MAHVVGIDLGTTNSLCAYVSRERPEIIPNAEGKRLTPSIVGLDRQDQLHVGDTAKNQLLAMPDRTIAEVKRLMGTGQKVKIGAREYTPQEVSGLILKKLKDDAEAFLCEKLIEAVVTVPAYFTDAQRQATKDAGELAGFKVDRILNEPTAAALAYGLDHLDKEQHILVYDLGGGTFDVSVLEMFEGVLDVKASAGNNHLGGGDFDRIIAEWLCKQFEKQHGIDLRKDVKAMVRLKAAAEQAKMELSTTTVTPVLLPFLAAKAGEALSLEIELTRQELERQLGQLLRSTMEPIEQAIKDAKLEKKDITDVVLVGGSSRIPMVQQLLAEFFQKDPRRGVNPDEAIALGAAVQAGLKSGAISPQNGIMITDVCPFTLGVEVSSSTGFQRMDGIFSPIIPRNSTVPVSRTETYATVAEGQRQVNIKVYQGESRLVKNNVFLDHYMVDGVPPNQAGHEKVAITFTYDINGILGVKTKILSTGKEAHLAVDKSSQRMSDHERNEARQRLEKEWDGPAVASATPAPAAAATATATATATASATPATTGAPGYGGAARAGSPFEAKALLKAAEDRLPDVSAPQRAQLESLMAQLSDAMRGGDGGRTRQLEDQLTNFLFEID